MSFRPTEPSPGLTQSSDKASSVLPLSITDSFGQLWFWSLELEVICAENYTTPAEFHLKLRQVTLCLHT